MEDRRLGGKFYIYFDCQGHTITPDEAIKAIELLKVCTEDFKDSFLNKKIDLKLEICPSEDGSYKLVASIAAILGFIGGNIISPIGEGISDGFWNRLGIDPKVEIGENIGESIADALSILLSIPNKELEKELQEASTYRKINLDRTQSRRSSFFKEIDKNQDITGIQIGSKGKYIPRHSYHNYIIDKDIIRPLDDEFAYKELKIKKPITIKDYVHEHWGFIDSSTRKTINAPIEDNTFIESLLAGKSPLKSTSKDDIILCKIKTERELKNGEERSKKISIIEIYSYNETELQPLPNDFEVDKIVRRNTKQMSLFDALNSEK